MMVMMTTLIEGVSLVCWPLEDEELPLPLVYLAHSYRSIIIITTIITTTITITNIIIPFPWNTLLTGTGPIPKLINPIVNILFILCAGIILLYVLSS